MAAPDQPSGAPGKDEVRRGRHASRAERDDAARRAAGTAIASHLRAWEPLARARVVAAYLSFGDEPPTDALVDALRADGVVVLAPRTRPGGLDWVPYDGAASVRPGRHGIPEPVGEPVAGGLGTVDVVLVPALAADRSGTRLGRGAGYYDRALAGVGAVPLVVVLFDDDLLPAGVLPAEPHDVPVTHAATPSGLHPLR